MKEKRNISRKQFLTGSASVIFGAIMGKLSEHVYAEEKTEITSRENTDSDRTEERDWDELPLDTLNGAYLVSDPESKLFGGTVEAEGYLLTQYFHVYPGLELMLTDIGETGGIGGWVGYNKELKPNAVLCTRTQNTGTGKRALVSVPEGVYFLRGSGKTQSGNPHGWVRNLTLYALNCGLNKPDLSSYMEITELSLDQRTRNEGDGEYANNTSYYPSLGDVFFSPVGTKIVITFKNANISPYINCGEHYMLTSRKKLFTRHYGLGYSWFFCRTTDICNWLGASYETTNGCAKMLTMDELRAAEPHLYIKFPSVVTQTQQAAIVRSYAGSPYKRLFTAVHVTDTHGDVDSTHAAYEYADKIGADFIALTGDYVPRTGGHGCSIIHSMIKQAKTPTVYSIGNHDVVGYSDKEVYERFIAPVKDVLMASTEHPYYYRDFQYDTEIVRIISLYPFCEDAAVRVNGYYTHEQLQWLCETMKTVPDNGHIFIMRHFPHFRPKISREEESMFHDYGVNDYDNGAKPWLEMDRDPITEIVDAYKERIKINTLYTGNKTDGKEAILVEYDFTNRPYSEFVAYFTGHTHNDLVGYALHTRTAQVVLCSLCTAGIKGTREYSAYASPNMHRDYGTDSQIALNVFAFDFKKKTIYVSRVGNGMFKDRQKTHMKLSYQ